MVPFGIMHFIADELFIKQRNNNPSTKRKTVREMKEGKENEESLCSISNHFFLIGTTTVFAVTNSHIGKEIQGEASLFLNDVEFVNKAIIVEGISFVPVREVSEKLGLNVEFEDGEIFLTEGESLNQGDIQVLTDLMGIAKREMDDASKAIQFHEDEIEKIKQLEEGFFELNQVSGEEYSIEFHEGRINAELAKFEEAESRYNEHKKLLESSK